MKKQLAKKIDKFKLGGTPNLNTVYINNLTKMLNNTVGNNQLSQAEYGMDMQFGDPTKPKKPQATKPVQPYYTSDREDYDYHMQMKLDSAAAHASWNDYAKKFPRMIGPEANWIGDGTKIGNKAKIITNVVPFKGLTKEQQQQQLREKQGRQADANYAKSIDGRPHINEPIAYSRSIVGKPVRKVSHIFGPPTYEGWVQEDMAFPLFAKPVQEVIFRANNNTIKKTLTSIPTKVKYANKKNTITNSNVVPEDEVIPQDEITPLDPMSFPQVARPEQQIIPAPPYIKPVHYAGPRYGTWSDGSKGQFPQGLNTSDWERKTKEYQQQQRGTQPVVQTRKEGGEPFSLNTKYINNLTNILNNVAGNNLLSQAAYGMNMQPGGPDKPIKPNNITTQDPNVSLEDYLKLYENSLALEKGITSMPNYKLQGSSNNVDDYLKQLAQAREYWADSPKELEQLQSQLSHNLNQSDQQRKYAELSIARKIETNNINDYHTVVSPNSFYQRDIQNGFVNKNFPPAYYDSRVKPSSRNNYSYQSSDENDNFFDNIQVYKYDPVEVKKQALLKYADSEEAFQNILNKSTGNDITPLKRIPYAQSVQPKQEIIPAKPYVKPVHYRDWNPRFYQGENMEMPEGYNQLDVEKEIRKRQSAEYDKRARGYQEQEKAKITKRLKPAVLTENFKEGGEPDKTLPDEEWYKKYQQQKAKYESDKAKGIISSTGYQDEVTVTPAANNRQKGIQLSPEKYAEKYRNWQWQEQSKELARKLHGPNFGPQSAGSADWFWTLPFAAPAAIEAAGAIGAMSLPFMSTIPGATVGNAAMAAGMANSFYKAPQNVKDWYDVSQGTKDWKEAAAGTGEIALGLIGSKAGFKSVADDVAQGAKTGLNYGKDLIHASKEAKKFTLPTYQPVTRWNPDDVPYGLEKAGRDLTEEQQALTGSWYSYKPKGDTSYESTIGFYPTNRPGPGNVNHLRLSEREIANLENSMSESAKGMSGKNESVTTSNDFLKGELNLPQELRDKAKTLRFDVNPSEYIPQSLGVNPSSGFGMGHTGKHVVDLVNAQYPKIAGISRKYFPEIGYSNKYNNLNTNKTLNPALPLILNSNTIKDQWHLKPATIEGGFKNGGDVESWVDDLDDDQIKAYRKAGYIVKVIK